MRTSWYPRCDGAVVEAPSPVRYARVDGVSLAYQTWGSGPSTLVIIPPMAQNIELTWERPEFRMMLGRLGTLGRVLHFDKRGTGASDRTDRMPTLDQRVEDLAAVIDDAGIGRAHLIGVSEGGPVALAFAATYPPRVDGVVLLCSGARMVGEETESQRTTRRQRFERFVEAWGTDESLSLDTFGPSVAGDASYRSWEPRYERQSASPAALRELLQMIEGIDVRALLPSIDAPVLALHRRDDRVWPIGFAREAVAGIRDAQLIELEGADHFAQVGDVDSWFTPLAAFVTGSTERPAWNGEAKPSTEIRVMGRFSIWVDGQEISPSVWGSRRARQLCKRLAVAVGEPVPREQLMDMLWPDEVDVAKLGARLSVLLSTIRRVLGGGLLADRAAVRLDLGTIRLDLAEVYDAVVRGDDSAAIEAYRGRVLPEDAYEDWARAADERLTSAVAASRRRLATEAKAADRLDDVVLHATALLDLDPFDERAHEMLVRAMAASGRLGDAARAEQRYCERMAELGVRPQILLD